MKFQYSLLVFLISYIIKEYKIEKGNYVLWDEAHFGKFSQSYLDRKFYFDVHPPLGKMLTALSGYIFKQSNSFKFTSKDTFPEFFDYVGMRRFHALIASFVPFFAFHILRLFNFSSILSLVLSLLFIFDNGLTSISRLILLDSHLLSFTAMTVFFASKLWVDSRNTVKLKKNDSLRMVDKETINLFMLGLSLGCVISIKWIGCLTMTLVGLYIAADLLAKLTFLSLKGFIKSFVKRALFLILLPIIIYTALFYVHFRIVNNSGEDDSFMSTSFQLRLKNNPFGDTKKYISYGKMITIKSGEGYLHSHLHEYPDAISQEGENRQLQVTTYSPRDSNNNFFFQKVSDESTAQHLRDGDTLAILHSETNSYLSIDDSDALISNGKRVVSRQNQALTSSIWTLEIEKGGNSKDENLRALTDRFYLRNNDTGLYLCSSNRDYPAWGFNQGEVIGSKEKSDFCLWQIEENFHSDSPLHTEAKKSFIRSLLEHNKLMFVTNKSFAQDTDLEPERIVSQPYEWPILIRGLRMSQWEDNWKFYMFMNPLLLYTSTLAVFIAPLIFLIKLIKFKRNEQYKLADKENKKGGASAERKVLKRTKSSYNLERDLFFLFVSFGGWCIHYLTFYSVGRVLYLHHYFPALFFAILNLCYCLKQIKLRYSVIFVSLVAISYWIYSPLTYGFVSENEVKHLKIVPTWDFVD